ncbi:MAG: EAL domain-containing protein [Thermoanaerobaculia bacterium]
MKLPVTSFPKGTLPEGLRSLQSDLAADEIVTAEVRLPGAHEELIRALTSDDQLLLANLATEHAPEGIVVLKAHGDSADPRIIFVNDAFCRITGMEREEVIGQGLQIARNAETDRAVRDALNHPACRRKPFEGEAPAIRKDGTPYSLELLLVPIHDGFGGVSFWVAYIKDVTDRNRQLAALEQQALHDVLTNLPNRILLVDRVEQAILVARRTGAPVALMIMDLDGFKEINDTLGHHAGDLLLQEVATRLRNEMSEADTVARLGGDEFAFVLPTAGDASGALRTGRRVIRALEDPFELEGDECEIGGSIGVAIYPDHGRDAATLMRRADAAMYHAKRTGRGCSLYSSEFDQRTSSSLALGVELRRAIEEEQLCIFYQPKIHLRTGVVTRVEALVRWNHPERGLMLPDEFIPLAERTGLIKPLTEWVLSSSLAQCAEWQRQGLPIHIAVNLSTRTLQEHTLPHTVALLLDRHGVEPHSLKLEITESSIMADPPHALAILSLLHSMGVKLSLDDFGTGYSSLAHLREMPVDEIKIDKSFIMGMATSTSDTAIVRATIDLAHSLGRQVVAEGVDLEATCRSLSILGCDLAQGFYLSRPLPAHGFERWLTNTNWGLTTLQKVLGLGAG